MFSFFKKKSLEPDWTFQSNGFIWRMLFSASHTVVIENRLKDQKLVNFCHVDLATGNVLWQDFTLEEPWFVGIEAIHQGHIFFHGYFDPNLPEHQGIYCADIQTGTLLWYDKDLTYFYFADDKVLAYKEDKTGRFYFSLNPKTGKVIDDFGQDNTTVEHLRGQFPELEGYDDVHFYEKVLLGHSNFDELVAIIGKQFDQLETTHGFDLILHQNYKIVGVYHNDTMLKLCYSMIVLDGKSNEVKLIDRLATELKGQVGDLFFFKKSSLLSMKDRSTLQSHHLI